MAVKAINNTTGLDRLVLTLLVYGTYLKINNLDPPAPSIIEQAAAIQKAMAKIVKLQAKQAVNNTLHHCNGPNMTLVYNLPLNSEVLIWQKSGNQTKPYRLLAIEDKTYYIQLPSRPTSFKSIFIKPYFWPKTTYNAKPDKLKVTTKLDKLEVLAKPDKPKVFAKLNKLT